jgi:hypothetical protein
MLKPNFELSFSGRVQRAVLCPVMLFSMCLSLFATAVSADSKTGNLGVGFILGEPTGLTAKYWMERSGAVDFGLAFSIQNYFLFYSDYLKHVPLKSRSSFVSHLNPYIGIGALAAFVTGSRTSSDPFFRKDGDFGFGVRIPLGVEWTPAEVPLGVFVELVPGIFVFPATSGFLSGGIGARYYF